MRHYIGACALAMLSVAALAAADAPYFGKWKIDASRSKVQSTVTIAKLPSGDYKYDGAGFVYTFQLDVKEYPMPDGGTTAWKATNATTWDVTNRANGKVAAKYTLKLNGESLTRRLRFLKPVARPWSRTSIASPPMEKQ